MTTQNTHGGVRPGAGRPPAEKTEQKRIPIGILSQIENIIAQYKGQLPKDTLFLEARTKLSLPLATERVQAGFHSPAAPYLSDYIDLNEYLVKNFVSTILVRVIGLSMINIGIEPGDLLFIDRSVEAHHRDVVLADYDGDFTLKRLIRTLKGIELHPENPDFPILRPKSSSTIQLVGVLMSSIKKFK